MSLHPQSAAAIQTRVSDAMFRVLAADCPSKDAAREIVNAFNALCRERDRKVAELRREREHLTGDAAKQCDELLRIEMDGASKAYAVSTAVINALSNV